MNAVRGTRRANMRDAWVLRVARYLFAEDGGTFIAYLPMSTGQYYRMGFRVDPRELRDTPIDLATMNATYVAKSIYATVNPFDSPAKVGVAKLQLARSISLMNPVRITDAYTKDSDPINPDIIITLDLVVP